jgi:hypothetical protein
MVGQVMVRKEAEAVNPVNIHIIEYISFWVYLYNIHIIEDVSFWFGR